MIKGNYYFYMPHMYDKTNFIKRKYFFFFAVSGFTICVCVCVHKYMYGSCLFLIFLLDEIWYVCLCKRNLPNQWKIFIKTSTN